MSRLNAKAFEFVPGQAFKIPPQPLQPPQPELLPVERPEKTEPPKPAPTISLNIGGSRPSQPAAEPPPPATKPKEPSLTPNPPRPSASTPTSHPSSPAPPAKSYNFSTEKAKTDTDAVAQEVHKTADSETLGDLFGKQHLNIVFVGHVDAGKSTMGGNLLYVTGMIDKRTMEKYEREAKEAGRESWYLSWALDSTPQERSKVRCSCSIAIYFFSFTSFQGKTVEVGRAYFETPARKYTILDAPGHKTYVPSMISGAAQADVAILVISSRKGEFETGFEKGGQTREHIMLVKTAGVSKIVVVINKMDDPTVEWNQARYNEIKDKLIVFIKAAGFNPKTDVNFIPVSAYTGVNLKDRVTQQQCPWWKLVAFDSFFHLELNFNLAVDHPFSNCSMHSQWLIERSMVLS
jgi:peptide chain release factor subunit 3